jgi:glycosyltransferase involved in cell wall biosynthesis
MVSTPSRKRFRVLVLTRTSALGGAERGLMNALPYLDRERFAYRFAALDDDGPLAAACRAEGLPFTVLPGHRVLDPRNPIALRRLLTSDRIELLHVHLPLTGALARAAARGLPVRVVYTEHSVQENYRGPTRWANAATYGWQTRVVAASEGVRSSAVQRIGEPARALTSVVPNGVDFDRLDREAAVRPFPPPPPGPRGCLRVLVPARLAAVKGHDVLLDALEILAERPFPPLQVWLAGDGPRSQAIASRIAAGPLAETVHLLGRRDDVFSLMRVADAVALPSRHEGHPLALLEALSLGGAVLATRVGGVPEIVRDGETGLLVPAEDPAALAAGLDTLRGDPELRRRLGTAAARDARARFDVRRSVTAVEAIYGQCLALPRREPAGGAEPSARAGEPPSSGV